MDEANFDVLDKDRIEQEIKDGSTALKRIKDNAGRSMEDWAVAIHGWRALRDLIFAETHTVDVNADAYRKAMTAKFKQRKFVHYSELEKWQRSAMYKLADCIDDVMDWYRGRTRNEQVRWQTPEAVLKHVDPKLLHGIAHGANRPKRLPARKVKPRAMPAEMSALYQIVISLVELLLPINEAKARKLKTEAAALMAQFHTDPNDGIPDDLAEEGE